MQAAELVTGQVPTGHVNGPPLYGRMMSAIASGHTWGNRVRMLKQEMAKANKKIEETKKKTFEIRQMKESNDRKYLLKLEKEKDEQKQ